MIGLRCYERRAGVAAFAQRDIDRHFAQERRGGGFGGAARAACAENVGAFAVGRFEIGHVLDHAENRRAGFFEHGEAAAHVGERHLLRRRDDDGAGERHALHERDLHVASAGRHVEHENVEIAPGDFIDHLAHRARRHRAAPDHRRVGIDEIADRHCLEAVRVERIEDFVAAHLRAPIAGSQQSRRGGAINVEIQEAGLVAERGERAGEIDGDSRFAHAAFGAGDGDDVLNAADAAGALRRGFRRLVRGQNSKNLADAFDFRDLGIGAIAYCDIMVGNVRRRFERKRDLSVIAHVEPRNAPRREQTLARCGVPDRIEALNHTISYQRQPVVHA